MDTEKLERARIYFAEAAYRETNSDVTFDDLQEDLDLTEEEAIEAVTTLLPLEIVS